MTPSESAPTWRRRVAALVAFVLTLLVAGFIYLAGAFSDWSGQHRMPPQAIVGAVVVLVVGSVISVVILRRGR